MLSSLKIGVPIRMIWEQEKQRVGVKYTTPGTVASYQHNYVGMGFFFFKRSGYDTLFYRLKGSSASFPTSA